MRCFNQYKARKTHSLDGSWIYHFSKDGGPIDWERLDPSIPVPVQVPCAWESLDAYVNYRGEAVASRIIDLQEAASIRIVFKGVSHTARILFDDVEVAQHHGAYTPFDVVIPNCAAGAHTLKVHVSNTFGEISALHVPNDYYSYGGITRPVELQVLNGSVYIKRIFFEPKRVDCGWEACVRLQVENLGSACVEELSLSLCKDVESVPLLTHLLGRVALGEGLTELSCELDCAEVEAWSPESPHLYLLRAALGPPGAELDDLIERVGFRTVEVHGEQLLLNGESVFLKGFNRHEDHPEHGCALPIEVMRQDLELMREANANAVRTSHYPNDERFLDLCDELGLLVWEENHARGLSLKQMQHPKFRKQCASCNEEMVTEHFNHPSIIIWGILNECASHEPEGREHYIEQFQQIKSLDTTRPTSFASCQHERDLCQRLPDICSWNTYYNWYSNGDVADELETTVALRETEGMAGKPFIMSEFGAGAIPGYHDPVRKGKWSEERQAELLDEYLEVLMAHPRLCGAFVWQFCDIRVDESWAMSRPRTMNNKGVLDEFRRKKMAFEVVQRQFMKQ